VLVLAPVASAGTPPPVPDLQSLTFAPNPVAPNGTTTGTVTLTGPAPPGVLGGPAGLDLHVQPRQEEVRPCRSPKSYSHLKRGRHTFGVEARDGDGTDRTPAVKKFRL
jgi:hypothetical protein